MQNLGMETRKRLTDKHPAEPIFSSFTHCIDERGPHCLGFNIFGRNLAGGQPMRLINDYKRVEALALLKGIFSNRRNTLEKPPDHKRLILIVPEHPRCF